MHWRSLNNIEFSLLFLFLIRINWFEIRQGKKKQPTKHKLNTLMRILSFYVRKCFFFKESQLFSAFSAFTLDSLNISWYLMEEKNPTDLLNWKGARCLNYYAVFEFLFCKVLYFWNQVKALWKTNLQSAFIWLLCIRSSTIYTLRTTCEIHLINIGYA